MKEKFKDSRRRFVAGSLSNVAVLLLGAATISEMFFKFNVVGKTGVIAGGLILLAFGIIICPNKADKEVD